MAKRLVTMTLSGREFKVKDFKLIKETISLFPALSRKELSKTLCEILEWYQANGEPKYLSCQKVLEKLEAWGHIKLPPLIKQKKGYHHKVVITEKSDPEASIFGQVDEYGPIVIEAINDRGQGRLWSEYIQRYHYLGHRNAVGSQQKYFIRFDSGELLGCILYSASAWAVGCRDKWIGWGKYERVKNLHLILSQSRFLIFPWIKVKNLASKVLSLSAKQVQKDWLRRYNFRPVMLESFVDKELFAGTCYKAAGWKYLGITTGRGRMDRYTRYLSSPKEVYVLPLCEEFRKALQEGASR
jgi:hypothetical protein